MDLKEVIEGIAFPLATDNLPILISNIASNATLNATNKSEKKTTTLKKKL